MFSTLKSALKSAARRIWRLTAPVRRPVVRKFDERLNRLVSAALQAHRPVLQLQVAPPDLSQIESAIHDMAASLRMARQVSEHHASEANLLMDNLLREVVRLQMQVEALSEQVDELRSAGPLAVVGPEQRAA
jgi:hypothetical protein